MVGSRYRVDIERIPISYIVLKDVHFSFIQ